MSAKTTVYTPAFDSAPAAGQSLFARLFGEFVLSRRAAAIARQLSALSDRELDDIGLARGEIGRVAREAAGAPR